MVMNLELGLKPKKKSHIGKLVVFIVFQLIFGILVMPLLIFYGPFKHVTKTVVGTSWATLNHRYIAQFFLSDSRIEKIIGPDYALNPLEAGATLRKLNFFVNHDKRIDVLNISGAGFTGKMLVIHDPTRIAVGASSTMPESGETTGRIAKNLGAAAAINAGGFSDEGWAGVGGAPDGFVIQKGKVTYNSYGDDSIELNFVGMDKDGMLQVGVKSATDLITSGVNEAISFGPALVINGEGTITQGDGGWGIAPRTAIGQKANGEVIFLVIDGRSVWSLGATLKDVQDIMIQYGAVNACNLDGGSSATMYYQGKLMNRPSDGLGERAVPTAFVVMGAS